MHPVEQFRESLDQLDRYPPGVVAVPKLVDGTAFFAAGPGLYCEQPPSIAGLPELPFGKTMFVGNNLDAEGPYRERLKSGIAHGDPRRPMRTWQGLYRLLDAADVNPRDGFFTNAYVGLIEGEKPTGRFPGASDAVFSFSAVALAHPSMYPASARGRVFRAALGADADAALLRAAQEH